MNVSCGADRPQAAPDADIGEAIVSLVGEIRGLLARAKARVDAEIRDYPTPIPRCDAQFNHLIEERARIAEELERVQALAARPRKEECAGWLRNYVASAPAIDEPAERDARVRAREVLRALAADRVSA